MRKLSTNPRELPRGTRLRTSRSSSSPVNWRKSLIVPSLVAARQADLDKNTEPRAATVIHTTIVPIVHITHRLIFPFQLHCYFGVEQAPATEQGGGPGGGGVGGAGVTCRLVPAPGAHTGGGWPGQRSRGCPMQPSFGCMGVFLCTATRFKVYDTSRPDTTKLKIPAQPTDGWSGHPQVCFLPRVLAQPAGPSVPFPFREFLPPS